MKIDNSLLERVLKVTPSQDISCDRLGLVVSNQPNTLTFLDDERFLQIARENSNVTAAFITENLAPHLEPTEIKKIICDDPRYCFYYLLNYLGTTNYQKTQTRIHSTAKVHPRAYVSEYNVEIGENVIIEPNATIMPDVIVGANCIIRAGAILGSEGYEHKRTTKGILSVFHDGKVLVGNNVEIGAGTCVDKGFQYRDTRIGDFTKIDNLVQIAHCVHIGKNCLIIACSMIGGTVTIMDDVWIGPNVTIAPHLTIKQGSFVTLGSVVTQNVREKEWVTGNFAVPHRKFLLNLKRVLSG